MARFNGLVGGTILIGPGNARIPDGYIMQRDKTGRCFIYVLEPPLILQWWHSLVSAA
jgi:hypothetical protein